jgi:CrcB protein
MEEAVRYLAVAGGAVLGANLRFIVTIWATDRFGPDFPYGTFIINVSGAFVIGLFLALVGVRAPINPLWRLFFATGFLGGYTTFSSYAWETLTLAQDNAWLRAMIYVGGSNVLGLIGVWLGAAIATSLPRE